MCPEIWIAIPSNILEDGKGLRAKTEKVGYIARAAAIFGVRRIYIYNIKEAINEAHLIELLLRYLLLPQYLRKKVYPIQELLRFAGELPPLKIPSHLVPKSLALVKKGETREGILVIRGDHVLVDVGLEKLIPLAISSNPTRSKTVTVLITSGPPRVSARVVQNSEIKDYWGYEVIRTENIRSLVSHSRGTTVILTSRTGAPLSEIWRDVSKMISRDRKCFIFFGSPRTGLFEALSREKIHRKEIGGYSVNLFPSQKVETVRSEEAILAGLGIINFLRVVGD